MHTENLHSEARLSYLSSFIRKFWSIVLVHELFQQPPDSESFISGETTQGVSLREEKLQQPIAFKYRHPEVHQPEL